MHFGRLKNLNAMLLDRYWLSFAKQPIQERLLFPSVLVGCNFQVKISKIVAVSFCGITETFSTVPDDEY